MGTYTEKWSEYWTKKKACHKFLDFANLPLSFNISDNGKWANIQSFSGQFFCKIIYGWKPLAIFAKKLYHRCFCKFLKLFHLYKDYWPEISRDITDFLTRFSSERNMHKKNAKMASYRSNLTFFVALQGRVKIFMQNLLLLLDKYEGIRLWIPRLLCPILLKVTCFPITISQKWTPYFFIFLLRYCSVTWKKDWPGGFLYFAKCFIFCNAGQ